jgi:hypothetical protein
MSTISPVSATPDVAHVLGIRRALDGSRTLADGVVGIVAPQPPSAEEEGTPRVDGVAAGLDLHL